MKNKVLSILITILAICTCIFTLTACVESQAPEIDYSKYNYYGNYSFRNNLSNGGTVQLDFTLDRNNKYEMTLDVYSVNALHLIGVTEEGNYSMNTLSEPIYDETFNTIYILNFNPHISTGTAYPDAIYGYYGYITQVYLANSWWYYIDNYVHGTTVYFGVDNEQYKAEYSKLEYNVTYLAGVGGTIDGNVNQRITEGEDGVEITAVADYGYIFDSWSDGITTATRKETNVNNDIAVTANFIESLPKYTLTYTCTDGGMLQGELSQRLFQGQDGSKVIAVANEGYEFVGWSDGDYNISRQDINVTSNITVTANFKLINFYTVSLYDEKEISTTSVQENSIIKLGCLSKEGYDFVGWLINGQTKSANESIVVEKDMVAYAQWSIITYDIMYHLNGGILEDKKSSFTIKDLPYYLPEPSAPPNKGFSRWSMGNQDAGNLEAITELMDYEIYANYDDALKYRYNNALRAYEVVGCMTNCTSIIIPETYNSIPVLKIGYAFGGCNKLTNIVIPDSIIEIEEAFSFCGALTYIDVDENNAYYKSIDGNLYNKEGNILVKYASGKTETSFTIPNDVTRLSGYAFDDCIYLEEVIIPYGLEHLGGFKNCYRLERIVIPESVNSIGGQAFYGCISLKNLIIPDSVKEVGSGAFENCENLKKITIESWYIAEEEYILEVIQDFTDVYIRTNINVSASIYSALFNNLGVEEIDGVEYYHYQIKE